MAAPYMVPDTNTARAHERDQYLVTEGVLLVGLSHRASGVVVGERRRRRRPRSPRGRPLRDRGPKSPVRDGSKHWAELPGELSKRIDRKPKKESGEEMPGASEASFLPVLASDGARGAFLARHLRSGRGRNDGSVWARRDRSMKAIAKGGLCAHIARVPTIQPTTRPTKPTAQKDCIRRRTNSPICGKS